MVNFKEFLNEQEQMDWLKSKVISESGYARVRRIMFGDVPTIRTIGIVTAQNPQGKPPWSGQSPWPDDKGESDRENRHRNETLEQYLRTRNYGPVKVRGKFGLHEDSFLIPNIAREELLAIGRWFEQEAVIWGERGIDHYGNPFFLFEYIDTETGKTKSVRSVHIGSEDVQGRSDYFTMVGGRKFIIPFFDDPHSRKVPGSKYGTFADVPDSTATPWTADELAKRVRKAETFAIPFFDDPSAEMIFDAKVNEMTYFSDRLQATSLVNELVEDIKKHTDAVFDGQYAANRAKHYWHHRGIVRESLWKLNCL
jgi:hypothetical protein